MSDPDGFLARWSRRKQEARHRQPPPVEPPIPGHPEASAEEPEAPPELPPVESITAETDISVFLAKGVADSIRNAALRRMWSLDPAIRDYVGDARDYAYDWNTPGGVPGFGPIDPSYDVEGTIARIFGDGQEANGGSNAAAERPAEVSARGDPAPTEARGGAQGAGSPPPPGEGPDRASEVGWLDDDQAPRPMVTVVHPAGPAETSPAVDPRPTGKGGAPERVRDSSAPPGEGKPRNETAARGNTPRHGRATPV